MLSDGRLRLLVDRGTQARHPRGAATVHGYREHIRRIGEEKLDASGDRRYPARRWVVERTLAWLSKCRAVLVRYDKKAEHRTPGPDGHRVYTGHCSPSWGVFAAYNWDRGRLADSIGRTLAFAGQSVPEFWLALVLIYIFGVGIQVNLGLADFTTAWLPIAGREGGWTHWILPTVTAGWSSMAGMLRLTRSSVLEVIGSDFVRTARAKGLPGRQVLWRHTVRNALIPIITATALLIVSMMNGIVLVEAVFGWGGIGRLLVTAVGSRDLFLVQGLTMIIGSMFLLANFLADVLYSVVDPRVKFQ